MAYKMMSILKKNEAKGKTRVLFVRVEREGKRERDHEREFTKKISEYSPEGGEPEHHKYPQEQCSWRRKGRAWPCTRYGSSKEAGEAKQMGTRDVGEKANDDKWPDSVMIHGPQTDISLDSTGAGF